MASSTPAAASPAEAATAAASMSTDDRGGGGSGGVAALLDLVSECLAADPQVPIVDLRPWRSYLGRRLAGSVSVPFHRLLSRLYLLPDRDQRLLAVLPEPHTYHYVTSEPPADALSWHDDAGADSGGSSSVPGSAAGKAAGPASPQQPAGSVGASPAPLPAPVYLRGFTDLDAFLRSRGWAHVQFVVDSEALWAAADVRGWVEHGAPGGDPLPLSRRWMFRPSPLLSQEIERVEAALGRSRAAAAVATAPVAGTAAAADEASGAASARVKEPQAALVPPGMVQLRALDVGCGSGRDVAWLASRAPVLLLPGPGQQPSTPAAGGAALGHGPAAAPAPLTGGSVHGSGAGAAVEPLPAHPVAGADGHAHQVQPRWHVTGIDNWAGALQRTQALLHLGHFAAGDAALHVAHVDPATGAFVPVCRDSAALASLATPSTATPAVPAAVAQPSSALSPGCGGVASVAPAPSLADVAIAQPSTAAVPSSTAAAAAAAAAAALHICDMPQGGPPLGTFDLVLCVRFLERAFLTCLPDLLAPGGFVLYSTFLDMEGTRRLGRPSGEDHLLKPGELGRAYLGPAQGLEVLRDEVMVAPDGRELCMFVARKRG